MYVLQLMDWYSASFCVLVIAVLECVAINWIYGNENFAANIKEMLGHYPGKWWRICWKFISPLIIVGILIFSFVKYTPAEYGEYTYPGWADAIGWVMALASIIPIFVVAIYKMVTAKATTLKGKWIEVSTARLDDSHKLQKEMRKEPELQENVEELEELGLGETLLNENKRQNNIV